METKPKTLQPFIKMCATIGALPTSYLVSMTYEEQLIWLCNFLEKEVIPVVNNNSEVVKELQEWFKNLDVQEEVNNKIEEMYKSGQLQEIITEYLRLSSVLGFDTVADMVAGTNIIDGSICKTTGRTTYNDGYGAFYRIRQVTTGDVIDGINIIALNVDPELIAELIDNSNNGTINDRITTTNDRITTVQNNLQNQINHIADKKYIFIGDSYSQGYNPDGNVTGWSRLLKTKMGLTDDNCIIGDFGGASFGNPGAYLYNTILNGLTNDDEVTDIIICGGYNDLTVSKTNIIDGMSTVNTTITSKFPNAKVHIGFIGGTTNNLHGDIHLKKSYYIEGCSALDWDFMPNLEYVLFNGTYLASDGIHPTQTGQNALCDAIYQALNGGYTYCKFYDLTVNTGSNFQTATIPFHLYQINGVSYLAKYSGVSNLNSAQTIELVNNGSIDIGELDSLTGIIGTKYIDNVRISIGDVVVKGTTGASYYNMNATLHFDENHHLILGFKPKITDTHNGYVTFESVTQLQIPNFCITYVTDSM